MIDDLTALAFTVSENKGVFALLLGSGLSRPAGIPTGWEITLDLIRTLATSQKIPEQPEWGVWYQKEFGKSPSYSELLTELGLTADERRTFLHHYIDPTPEEAKAGKKRLTVAHRSIARLVRDGYIKVLITTNFDRLIENAIKDEGVEPTIIKSADDLKGSIPLVHSRCVVLKLHGDYLDARILNTEDELSKYTPEIDGYLDRIIDEFGLIICGWSGEWDPALRAAVIRSPNRRYPMFFAARSTPSDRVADLITHRAGRVISIKDADDFFESLQSKVSLIEQARQPNPRSVALLVERAKQVVGKPEHKVDQSDLLGATLRTALELRRAPDLRNVYGMSLRSDHDLQTLAVRTEALAEPISRLLGIWGRYGDGTEAEQAIEAITALSTLDVRNGVESTLELQRYPGMLALYGYGLGALKALRFDIVFRLFSQSIDSLRGTPKTVVDDFFLSNWYGQRLPWGADGGSGTPKPFSDHLENVFKTWSRDYIYDEVDFLYQFARFEALGAIAYIALRHNIGEIRSALAQAFPHNFLWAPHGLLGRDLSRRDAVIQWLAEAKVQDSLLAAGFGLDKEHLLTIMKNLAQFWSNLRHFPR